MKRLMLILMLFGTAKAATAEAAPCLLLDCPLYAINSGALKVPDALAQLGLHLQQGYVLFGIELRFSQSPDPLVSLHINEGDNLGKGVQQIVKQLPGYTWRQVSAHLVNVFPASANQDRDNILNLPLAHQIVKGIPADLITRPTMFIPELNDKLSATTAGKCRANSPGIQGSGPEITIERDASTVRDFLNAVLEAELAVPVTSDLVQSGWVPVGWVYTFRSVPGERENSIWEANWSIRTWRAHKQ